MNCSFCGRTIEPGTGTMFVTRKGKIFYFCASKCKKNLLKLKRKPRKVRWTREYIKEKEIRIRALSRDREKVKKEKKVKTIKDKDKRVKRVKSRKKDEEK
ncbi:MAG: 50S ribosomal protein L24e [Candidatus Altiarchaeales archaeon]|nr:MAG: 50S ribosomal protein L24e [Candidatus Altiarchaeales archaeon]RLI93835.1 MAG: 50S ribosomal protein L24e [Candidatus Altiarchaeales archaeon]RLI94122.1 MAG: 50S ribosomal protein L24e [Candidatus Altiarchaeales archaeon]